jgi:hypothetical protein
MWLTDDRDDREALLVAPPDVLTQGASAAGLLFTGFAGGRFRIRRKPGRALGRSRCGL